MNILNKLTIKHLKMNKKRTLVTIIGIVLSTALMVGIGLLISSVLTTERQKAAENYGSFHAMFNNLSDKEMSIISKNINIDKFYYYVPLGFAKFNSGNEAKPYIYVTEANSKLLETLNLINGRLPENSNELVISEHLISNGKLKVKVGDTITLDIGTRYDSDGSLNIAHNYSLPGSWNENDYTYVSEEIKDITSKTYTIVGIVDKTFYESYSDAGYMAFSLNTNPKNIYNAFVEFKKPSKTFEYLKDIENNLKSDNLDYGANTNILYYYGATKYSNVNDTIIPLIIIALSVISIGCIIVIYNSFAISTMERKKSFGLYASIGATHKQIRSSVFFEAVIVGLIGIILGIISAFFGIYIVIEIINNLLKDTFGYSFIFSVEPLYLAMPLIFMVLVIFLSAYLPAKRSSKVSPIEAIRGNDEIKISKREVKTPKFINKLFGIEGDIAYKNIKRNKRKYRITIISLFISIVMFNTFTSYLKYVVKATDSIDYYDYDVAFNIQGNLEEVTSDINLIKQKYNITDSLTIIDELWVTRTNLKKNDFTQKYQDFYHRFNGISIDTTDDIGYIIKVLADEDYNKITNSEAVLLNNKYLTIYNEDERKTISLSIYSKDKYNLELKNEAKNLNLSLDAIVINDDIWGLKITKYDETPLVLINESTYKEKIGYNNNLCASLIINTPSYKTIDDDIDNKKNAFSSTIYFHSPKIDMAETKNLVITVKILFYGFITLVTLIGVTSVINTINTNINLRRKEFAMLRSIGLSPKGFNKLLFFESLFFGLKSLIYGIPVSLAINYLISLSIGNVFDTNMIINWSSLIISIIAVFLIVLISMNYASKKIKRENILEALREENI